MLLYHPNSDDPVDCHPTQIEAMKEKGWVESLPAKQKAKAAVKNPADKTTTNQE